MPENDLFTILHISDFHFAKRRVREQAIVVGALIDDLRSLCVGHRKPDLTIFSGDLVNAAGIDSHDEAYDILLDPVSKATGCSEERIFIAAGNHDVSWAGLERFRDATQSWRGLVGKTDEISQFNELYLTKAFDAAAVDKFSSYLDLENYIRSSDRDGSRKLSNIFLTVIYIAALNVDLVIFNTAVFSTGGHHGFAADERNLVVPEYAIMEAIAALNPGSFRIFVTHHPFSALSEQCARILEREITKHGNIHLFGHMHDPQPKLIVGLRGKVISNQAGAIFTSRSEYYIGYGLITIDRSTGNSETLIRSYFKDRNAFDDGIDVLEGGRWYPSVDARQDFRRISAPIDEAKFRAHLAGSALKAWELRELATGGEGDLRGHFVAPPLVRTHIQETTGNDDRLNKETPVDFSDVVGGDANLILYAKAEYGRTTLLREIRFRSLAYADSSRLPRLPAMIDFNDISSNVENMLRKMKAGAELLPPQNDFESLLRLGYCCLLIDDVQFTDTRRMKIMRDFIDRFPKARYILSSPQASTQKVGAFVDPEMSIRFEFVELREFRRSDMRQLLIHDARCTDVEGWLDRLQDEFREINLPFTAANGSILIEILSEKYNFTPINRAVLMEQFVDSTLRKAAIEQSRRETFDYTNKTDLLSHVASWMARSDDYVPLKKSVRAEMLAYIDVRGLNVDIDALLLEFLTARIFLIRNEERLSFRYRGVLEYFIALRMTTEVSFKNWIMEEDRYLRFVNEIQYYAGKLRNDADLVNLIAERHDQILNEVLPDISDSELRQLDSVVMPSEKGDAGIEFDAKQIVAPPLSQDEKDAELDLDLPKDAEDRQEVFRPKMEKVSDRVTLSLFLYSGMLKNMELISDTDKRRHLHAVLRGWALVLVEALRLAPRLANERKMRINGALYEVQAPHGMSNSTVMRRLMVQMPNELVRILSGALASEKLERQLTEPTLIEQNEPSIFEFMRTGLIVDLGLPATPRAIKNLAIKLRDKHYLLWSLIVHLNHVRRLDRIKEEHFNLMKEPLAAAFANLQGGSHTARLETKRKELARLQKDSVIFKMKKDRES